MLDTIDILEDFAGPGGWDEGARLLGSTARILGREINKDAVATAAAAGHTRKHCSVLDDDPTQYRGVRGYIASPPCQTFSTAGKGAGRKALEHLKNAARLVATGMLPKDAVAAVHDEELDERSVLVLEPLRVIRAVGPQWIAMEQVPNALPVFEVIAEILREHGYHARTGVVNAEEHGVPQTRRRCILVAVDSRLADEAPWPTKTHSRFYSRDRQRVDAGYQPPVTMAEALGWGMTRRPYVAVAAGTEAGGTDPQCLGGSGARKTVRLELEEGRWITKQHDDAPSTWAQRFTPEQREVIATLVELRANNQSGTQFDWSWPLDRPATAVAGRGLVQNPGATKNRFNGSTKSRNDGVRVSVAEAGVLQSFREDYPWQGDKSSQYQRVGDAVPPVLGAAVLEPLLALSGFIATEQRTAA